jgi:hypothetical protein
LIPFRFEVTGGCFAYFNGFSDHDGTVSVNSCWGFAVTLSLTLTAAEKHANLLPFPSDANPSAGTEAWVFKYLLSTVNCGMTLESNFRVRRMASYFSGINPKDTKREKAK